jgi:CRISPR-associated protein Csb1
MSNTPSFETYLGDTGPAALVLREWLQPVEGPDGVFFPPTFAAGDGFPGGYNIDTFPDGTSVCLIDTVGAQANRIEPLFARDPYKPLVPQIVVVAGEKQVSLFEAGHRAGDAIIRCSELQQELHAMFQALLAGNAEPLARLAPTSLVFGVWDSRDTQAKVPRLVASTIRAFRVKKLTRSATYIPPVDYAELGVFTEEELKRAERLEPNPLTKQGFLHVPACGTHGGILAEGGIRRDATLSLAALRLLAAGPDPHKTNLLRRYILGLALTAFTCPPTGYLRQGCQLVLDPTRPRELHEVYADGRRVPAEITHEQALAFATIAAREFGVGPDRTVRFDPDRARADVSFDSATPDKAARKSRKK